MLWLGVANERGCGFALIKSSDKSSQLIQMHKVVMGVCLIFHEVQEKSEFGFKGVLWDFKSHYYHSCNSSVDPAVLI